MRSEQLSGRGYCTCGPVFVRVRYWLCAVLIGVGASGCAWHEAPFRRLAPEVDRSQPSALFFFVDGLDDTRLYQMLAAGELPNIQKRFVEGGVQVRQAVTSLPSITYPNCTSMITGQFPGHHGILGNYWFDRYTLFARYYMTLDTYRTVNDHFIAPTIYDALHDEYTFNIQAHTRRGVMQTIDNRGTFAQAWLVGDYSRADEHVGQTLDKVVLAANRVGRWPRVVMTYYPGVDEIGHRCGSQSPRYGQALKTIDQVIGRVTRQLEASGLDTTMYYCLVTDHSLPPVAQHVDLLKWVVANRGAIMLTDPVLRRRFSDRFRVLNRYDTVGAVDAGRLGMFHLRSAQGWKDRPSTEEVRQWVTRAPSMLEIPAVELVAMRAGDSRVRLLSCAGSAVVERRLENGAKQYRVVESTGDVLYLAGRSEYSGYVAAGWHGSREWLAASTGERYPDLVPQVVEMFDSSHTGDVVVFARQGWSFAFGPAENGGHGSCLAGDMHVPMMFSGPGLPRGASIEFARGVDIAPTVLGLIGEAERIKNMPGVDGINLAEELRQAK